TSADGIKCRPSILPTAASSTKSSSRSETAAWRSTMDANVTEAGALPHPLAARLAVLENLVRESRPETCAALRDVETIVADTLGLIENSLSIEALAQSAIL